MVADVFNLPCETLETDQGPAFGAALIAGVGAGVWPSLKDACNKCIHVGKTYKPRGVDYEDFYKRYCDLYPHLKPWFGGKT
jgi:xylulokinase